jgi:hypothetical protein
MTETTRQDEHSGSPACSPSFEAVPPFRVGDHGWVLRCEWVEGFGLLFGFSRVPEVVR